MSRTRITPVDPPYSAELQAQFDKIIRGAPPLLLFRKVARNDILGEINSDGLNGHGLPLSSELMSVRTARRGTSLPVSLARMARHGEVPFMH
jgi:hypothetical protein